MKLYYDPKMYPDVAERCQVNDDIVPLQRDIEYIPADDNRVVLSDEIDESDWDEVRDNWEVFFDYIISTFSDIIDNSGCDFFDEYPVIEVFEHFFDIIENF